MKGNKKPAKEMAGPPKTTKRKRTRKVSARAQYGSYPH